MLTQRQVIPSQLPVVRGKVKLINGLPMPLTPLTWASHIISSFLPLPAPEETESPPAHNCCSPVQKAALPGKAGVAGLTTRKVLPKSGSTNTTCP